MLFKGSRPQVLSGFRVWRNLHCTSLLCRIPQWLRKEESTLPAITYPCRGKDSYSLYVEHRYRMMCSQSTHTVTSLVVQNFQSVANRQNGQKRGPVVVLGTGPKSSFGSGSSSNPAPDHCNGFPHKTCSSKVIFCRFNLVLQL